MVKAQDSGRGLGGGRFNKGRRQGKKERMHQRSGEIQVKKG